MAKKQDTKFEQTKSRFRLMGKINKLDVTNERCYRKGVTRNGDNYESLKFSIQTSPTNSVPVEIFGMERDKVYFYSNNDKKTQPVDFGKRTSIKVPYHYNLIGIQLRSKNEDTKLKDSINELIEKQKDKCKTDEDKKKLLHTILSKANLTEYYVSANADRMKVNLTKTFVELDAIDYIIENFQNGDDVYVEGTMNVNSYTPENGEARINMQYQFNKILSAKEIDFEAEDFKEIASFEFQGMMVDTYDDDENKDKLNVELRQFQYGDKYEDFTFILDGERFPKMKKGFKTRLKFGDVIDVKGNIKNQIVLEEIKEENPFDDDFNWGGEDPNGFSKQNAIEYTVTELEITNFDPTNYTEGGKGKYKEDDFIADINPFADDLDGDEEDSFDDGGGEAGEDFDFDGIGIDIDDDDLPF